MMGLNLGEDRLDRRISLDHGRIHLFAEGMELLLLSIGRRRAGLMGRFQGLLFRGERGISRDGRIMGLFQFGLFSIGQETHAVVKATFATAGRWAGRRGTG